MALLAAVGAPLLLHVAAALTVLPSSESEAFWPVKGGDLNHSGFARFAAPRDMSRPTWLWSEPNRKYKGHEKYLKAFHGSPVIDGKFNVYIQSTTGWVYSIDRFGKTRWEFNTRGRGDPGNLAFHGGTVYTTAKDGVVFAIDATTGRQRWRRKVAKSAPSDTHSLTIKDNILLTACNPHEVREQQNAAVCALDARNGKLKWTFNMVAASKRDDARGTNQVHAVFDGGVFFADSFGGVYKVSLENGEQQWYKPNSTSLATIRESHGLVPYGTTATMILGPNGKLYNAFNEYAGRGIIQAIDVQTGDLLWEKRFRREINVAPAVGRLHAGGPLAVVAVLGRDPGILPPNEEEMRSYALGILKLETTGVVALDAESGERQWTFETPKWNVHCAGSVYTNSGEDFLCAPDCAGTPTIGADGTIYVNWSGGESFMLRDRNGDGWIDVNDEAEVSRYRHGFGSNGQTAIAPGFAVLPTCRQIIAFGTPAV